MGGGGVILFILILFMFDQPNYKVEDQVFRCTYSSAAYTKIINRWSQCYEIDEITANKAP